MKNNSYLLILELIDNRKNLISKHPVIYFIIFHGSRVRDPPKMMDFDHLDTLFVKKKCVVLTFPINLAGVLASETRITSFIYKTEVVLENIFFRISSFIYELRRVLRRRLYATRNFPTWGPHGARGRPRFADSPKP